MLQCDCVRVDVRECVDMRVNVGMWKCIGVCMYVVCMCVLVCT